MNEPRLQSRKIISTSRKRSRKSPQRRLKNRIRTRVKSCKKSISQRSVVFFRTPKSMDLLEKAEPSWMLIRLRLYWTYTTRVPIKCSEMSKRSNSLSMGQVKDKPPLKRLRIMETQLMSRLTKIHRTTVALSSMIVNGTTRRNRLRVQSR